MTNRRDDEDLPRLDDAFYRRFFEVLGDGAYVVDATTGRFLAFNDAVARVFGYTREQLQAMTVTELSRDAPATQRVLQRGPETTVTRAYRRGDGGALTAESAMTQLEWQGRRTLLGITRDVTAREQLLIELNDNRALVATAFERSPMLKSISEQPSGKHLQVNDAFCAFTGWSREEMIGRTSVELGIMTAEDRVAFTTALQSGSRAGHVLDVKRRDGRRERVRLWMERFETSEGVRLLTTGEPLGDSERVAEVRQEALHRLERIASRVPGVMYEFVLRPDGSSTVPFASPGLRDLMGVDPSEVKADGAAIFRAVHPDDLNDMLASVRRSAEQLSPWHLEFRVRLSQTRERWLSASSVPERQSDGSTVWHGYITDITEQRAFQANLAQNDRLASMGMLAAGVAHEINNPLAYVLANLEDLACELPRVDGVLLRALDAVKQLGGDAALAKVLGADADLGETKTRAELLEESSAALEGTRRIRKISRGLGTFSRVESGEARPIDVVVALDAAAAMAHNEVKFRAKLVREFKPVAPVCASEGKLAQVFLNLIINAAHAIEEGHADTHRITLRTFMADEQVVVEVADTGRGIAPEHLARVFEPFFTTKGPGVGSGLGLAISRNIVSEYGGHIGVESTPGRGTCVTIHLPVAQPETATASPAPTFAPQRGTPPRRGRVLIIDDEPDLRRTLGRVLRDHEVVLAASGREAQAIVEKDERFDVVLCDLMMPEVSGIEFHRWLCQTRPTLAERVVFLSGGAFTASAATYLETVKNVRLEKPFDPARLMQLVAERVSGAASSSSRASG